MGQCFFKCYRNTIPVFTRAILSCFGCHRCCFRPTDEDLIAEFCICAKNNDVKGLTLLAGRVRILKGIKYEIGQLCSRVPREAASSNSSAKHNPRRISALHSAAMHDRLEIILYMLKMTGCKPNGNREIPCQYTPLHIAAKEGYTALTNLLIKYKVHLDSLDWKKNTALILAASNGHQRCVKALIDHGALVNVRNGNGFNALIGAIINGRQKCAIMLIKLGSDLTITDVHGNTPLHLAIVKGDVEVVKFLLQCDAKVYAFNKYQASTLDEAKRCQNPEIFEVVQRGWSKYYEDVKKKRDAEDAEEEEEDL